MVDPFNSELRYLFDPIHQVCKNIVNAFYYGIAASPISRPSDFCFPSSSLFRSWLPGLEELLCVFYQHVFTLMFSHFSLWNLDGTQMFLDLPNLKHQSFDQLWIPVHSFVCMLKVILVETAFDDILVLRLLRPDSARTNLFTNLHKPTVFRSVFPLRPEFAESIAQIHEVKKKVRNHSESAESRSSFSSSLPPKQPGPGISILGSQVYKDPDNRHIEVAKTTSRCPTWVCS